MGFCQERNLVSPSGMVETPPLRHRENRRNVNKVNMSQFENETTKPCHARESGYPECFLLFYLGTVWSQLPTKFC